LFLRFLSFPLVGNLSFSEGLRTSRNDGVTVSNAFVLILKQEIIVEDGFILIRQAMN